MRRTVITLSGLVFLLGSSVASAQVPPILRAGTHPMWASLGMGGAINVKDSLSQFKLTEEFGYHFFGNASGPAIALNMQEGFGNDFVSFYIGPKFVWDIALKQDLGVYLAPSIQLSYLYATASAFDIQIAFAGKLILGDRGYVFFQPLGFDMGIRSDFFGVRFDLIFGGGAIF